MMDENTIERLAIDLANAKDVENNAKNARIEAEEALAAAIGGKEIGATTVKAGRFGITVRRGYTYKIDMPRAFSVKYPDFVKITEKVELNAGAYEEQRTDNTDLFHELSEHVTAIPRKVAVELKL